MHGNIAGGGPRRGPVSAWFLRRQVRFPQSRRAFSFTARTRPPFSGIHSSYKSVIPKRNIKNAMALDAEDAALARRLGFKPQELAASLDCAAKGARLVLNRESDRGRTVGHPRAPAIDA